MTRARLLPSWPMRALVALAAALMYAGASGVPHLRRLAAVMTGPHVEDPVSVFEKGMRELRDAIPRRGIVGYISDPPRPGLPREVSRDHYRRFILTQYTMAPVVVRRSADRDTVIANFAVPGSADTLHTLGFSVARDLGGGILLLERRR